MSEELPCAWCFAPISPGVYVGHFANGGMSVSERQFVPAPQWFEACAHRRYCSYECGCKAHECSRLHRLGEVRRAARQEGKKP